MAENAMLNFGYTVSISTKYKRVTRRKPEENGRSKLWRIWDKEEYYKNDCIFLGYRTLSNGTVEYEDEVENYFYAQDSFKVALVCPGPNLNPVYVPLHCIKF